MSLLLVPFVAYGIALAVLIRTVLPVVWRAGQREPNQLRRWEHNEVPMAIVIGMLSVPMMTFTGGLFAGTIAELGNIAFVAATVPLGLQNDRRHGPIRRRRWLGHRVLLSPPDVPVFQDVDGAAVVIPSIAVMLAAGMASVPFASHVDGSPIAGGPAAITFLVALPGPVLLWLALAQLIRNLPRG